MVSEIQPKANETEAISKICPEASQMISDSEAGGEQVTPFQGGNPSNPQAPQDKEVGVKTTSRRKTVLTALAALLFILALATATAVPLYFKYRPSATLISEDKLPLSDGSIYRIILVSYQDQNILEPSVRETFTVTSESRTNSRLLQEQKEGSKCLHYSHDEAGITIRQCSGQKQEVFLQLQKTISYFAQKDPELKRLLLEQDDSDQTISEEEILQELNSLFTENLEMDEGTEFEFNKNDQIILKYNPERQQFQNKNEQKRLLFKGMRQLSIFKKFFRHIVAAIKKVIKPVIKVIREAGPYIGAAVGAVAGFVVGGGPVGAIAGAQIGYKVGNIAQKVVQTCLPKDNLQIKCQLTPKNLVNIGTAIAPTPSLESFTSNTFVGKVVSHVSGK